MSGVRVFSSMASIWVCVGHSAWTMYEWAHTIQELWAHITKPVYHGAP